MRRNSFILTAFFLLFARPVAASELPSHPLIEKAKEMRAPRVQYAQENGAQVELTSDGKSFYLYWFPEGADPAATPVVVTMHGHGSYAFEDFQVWHKFLKSRGYGFLAIQWWVGEGEATSDYLKPEEMYRTFDQALKKWNVPPVRALLHGFSRGSANIYPVAALDRQTGNNYFSLFIANAGRANMGYPPVHEIEENEFGEKPFADTKWITYAGAKDTNPDRDGIPGMRETADWLRSRGGEVVLALEDPAFGHGGFHLNPKNCNAALDEFDKILK